MNNGTHINDNSLRRAFATQQWRHHARNSWKQTVKRRSTRVEKPRSVHQSPHAPERRGTFTITRPYATLEDHYHTMLGEPAVVEREAQHGLLLNRHRPFSWHPSSSQYSGVNYQMPYDNASTGSHSLVASHESLNYYAGPQLTDSANAYGSMPSTNGGLYQSAMSQTSLPTYQLGQESQEETAWPLYPDHALPMTSGPPAYSITASEQTSWLLPEYSQQYEPLPQYHDQPAESDFLPIQHPGLEQIAPLEELAPNKLEREDSNVLVGMGLYDPPGSTLFGLGGERKSLKLEEEWEPPELHEDNEADQNDPGGEISEEEAEEAPDPPIAPHGLWSAPMQPNVLPPASNLAGQSFFFDDDDTITSEWWYEQLKQRQPTAQDAGIGYGWLQRV